MTYYDILGVSSDSSIDDIKKSYRRLAKEVHPDLNKNANKEDFIKLQSIYETLSDPDKRMKYDMSLGDHELVILQDITISVMESIKGCSKKVILPMREKCNCGSLGVKCIRCQGTGCINKTKNIVDTCPRCHGFKYENPRNCTICNGAGIYIDRKSINFNIPPGIGNNSEVATLIDKYKLKTTIKIEKSSTDKFARLGNDLVFVIAVDPITALLGGKLIIPTLDGSININLRENTADKSIIRIPGKGVPKTNGSLLISIRIDNSLTDMGLLEKLKGAMNA